MPWRLQRSISFRSESRGDRDAAAAASSSTLRPRVISNPTSSGAAPAAKRRDSKLWSETFDVRLGAGTQTLSPKEIKRQEVRKRTSASCSC